MSNTPTDEEIDDFLDSPAGLTWVIADNRERYRLLVRAVLAKWGTPQPVVREPLSDEQIRAMCKESWVFETARQWVRIVEQLHGIKGGQHGTDT